MNPVKAVDALRDSAELAAGMTIIATVFMLVQALLLMEHFWWWAA